MSAADRELTVVSVGLDADVVNLWMRPLWLKSDLAVPARLTVAEARQLAIKLLTAAEGASGYPR